MSQIVRIALAQINTVVGDLSGNADRIISYIKQAKSAGAHIVAFPELALCGYPPEDLLLKPKFIEDAADSLNTILPYTQDIIAIVGHPHMTDDLYNAAAIIHNGKIINNYHKILLPNYGVFDEFRYFKAGSQIPVFKTDRFTFGVNICEDIWFAEGPTMAQAMEPGCQLIVNISSSPYYYGKGLLREKMVGVRAYDNQVFVAYVNAVGGQDELVFDGQSLVAGPDASIIARAKQFEEELMLVDIDLSYISNKHLFDPKRRQRVNHNVNALDLKQIVNYNIEGFDFADNRETDSVKPNKTGDLNSNLNIVQPALEPTAEIYEALKTGLRDYVKKNGFDKVVLGLSGGIDSALTAAICVDALGPEAVTGVTMPSRYSSEGSVLDSEELAHNLGIRLLNLSIEPVFEALKLTLSDVFAGVPENITEENMQPRIRGMLLMALSNKFNWLVIATGNKSEMAVGYTTLYGDMVGGFAVLKDIFKTTVYELAAYRNSLPGGPVIPESTIYKAPSAELKPDQKDEDTLPPYPVLDRILLDHVEQEKRLSDIVAEGLPADKVKWSVRSVDRNEYKRRQGPIGIKISPRAFGKDRRVPITNAYHEDNM
jgi:NAD+ synthase (glutamine-hydrolysing)